MTNSCNIQRRASARAWLLGLALCTVSVVPAAAQSAGAKAIEEIRAEAARPNFADDGRPLPLLASWNTGGAKREGFTPAYQLRLLEEGRHLLPWLPMPDPNAKNPNFADYETTVKKLAEWKLPITFIGTQWERLLTADKAIFQLPPDQNPNVIGADGKVQPRICPFGAVEPWRQVGAKWTSSAVLAKCQQWYPDPPLVLFLSNNEHPKISWYKIEECKRYLDKYGAGKDDDFKRKVVGEGWIERYRALQHAMRGGLESPTWQQAARFAGYEAFGPIHFARWAGWKNHSLYTPGRISVWPLAWDGGAPSFYTNNWEQCTDFTVFSPQVQAMNWVFMLREAHRLNPQFWFEMSVWDGWSPGKDNDKRKAYASMGQTYTPERYAGMAQFGMWLLRPRVVREFRAHRETLADCEPYFIALADAVDRVYSNETLRQFWREGELVVNPAAQHPFNTIVPDEYKTAPRWFLLSTNLDPKGRWRLQTELPVFALALVRGAAPNRSWLIYVHSPLQDRKRVQITVPGFGGTRLDAPIVGAFYVLDENTRKATAVNRE